MRRNLLLILLLIFTSAQMQATSPQKGNKTSRKQFKQNGIVMTKGSESQNPQFAEVERLIKEEKLNQALEVLKKMLVKARAAKDTRLLTEALIRATNMQV